VRIAELRREFELEVRYRVFPLHPEVPPEGMTLAELFAGRPFDLEGAKRRLRQVADELGVPLSERDRTCNSRRVQELGKWAEEEGRGDAWRETAYRAYFVDGANLHLPETLADIATASGLDPDRALAALEDGHYAAAVEADWQRAGELGVTAVPTLLCEGRRQVGFAPYDQLRRLVTGR